MRILFVSSEVAPYSKTGGLADVSSALPAALKKRGHDTLVVTPRYAQIDVATWDLRRRKIKLSVPIKGKAIQGGILDAQSPEGVSIAFIDQPKFFERGGLYGENGKDYPDNDERFSFLCHAALETCLVSGFSPDVIHLNDWQTAPIAALVQYIYRDKPEINSAGTLLTIHNLGYQGLFPPEAMMSLGLDWHLFTPSTLEFFGKLSFLKAGLVFADKLTTVSPRYAQEIQTDEMGFGLDGILRDRSEDLRGILNGANYRDWDPMHDDKIVSSFSIDDLSGKTVCKADLQQKMGLPMNHDAAIIGCISRLSDQKGIDLFLDRAEDLLALDCQFVFLGEGQREIEKRLEDLSIRHPHRLAFHRGYNEELAHVIQAGSDMLLVPSRYEPCGLTQIYALRYGTVPIVRAVGGLDDTIDDADDEYGTGFKFPNADPNQLFDTIKQALVRYSDRIAWRRLMESGMSMDFSWDLPARRYEAVYKEVTALRK